MAGPASAPVSTSLAGSTEDQASADSFRNSCRMAVAAEKLAAGLQHGFQMDGKEFVRCCVVLANSIDYAVTVGEIPEKARDLPRILKQVCQCRHELSTLAAVMVLMISVKNVCQLGWFPEKDSRELLALADELGRDFGIAQSAKAGLTTHSATTKTLMSRFYPLWRMNHVFATIEAEPGYNTYLVDFHISKKTKLPPQGSIRLFVAQTDNIETSACLVTPEKASFLVNGMGVCRRTAVLPDSGPQIPTKVTGMLIPGPNLLQAVGQFNGHYIIILAIMSVSLPPVSPVLEEYVQPSIAEKNTDSDIIEGPSRISLNCPISHMRIKHPVKGHLCKHLQCFDYHSYVAINTRKPVWRCPHCNQPVNYTDIRIDENMVKVLKEVGDNVDKVIITEDGSWKAVMETDEHVRKVLDKECDLGNSSGSKEAVTVMDLTGDDTEMDVDGHIEVEDRKLFVMDRQSQSNAMGSVLPANEGNSGRNNQNSAALEEALWSSVYRSLPPPPTLHMTSAVLTDAISPALNREPDVHGNISLAESPAPMNYPLQQTGHDQVVSQEYSVSVGIPRTVFRVPTAVQALPAPSQVPCSLPRPNSLHLSSPTLGSNSPLLPSPRPSSSCLPSPPGPGPNFPNFSSQANLSSLSLGNFSNRTPLNHSGRIPATAPYSQNRSTGQNRSQDGQIMQQWANLYLSTFRPPSSLSPQTQTQQAIGHTSRPSVVTTTMSAQTQNARPGHLPGRGMVQRVTQAEDLVDVASNLNWRPSGRMRGSLVPGAWSKSLEPLIIRPSQSAQTSRPPVTQPFVVQQPRPQSNGHSVNSVEAFVGSGVSGVGETPTGEPLIPPGFNGPPPAAR